MMENVPEHLQIKVLFEDEAVIVIDKPPNLRSVPGHASPPPPAAAKDKENGQTSQECWAEAIYSFCDESAVDTPNKWLLNLAITSNITSIPRKRNPFLRYIKRNQRRLNTDKPNQSIDMDNEGSSLKQSLGDTEEIDEIARTMFERIRKRQMKLMNLPEATAHQESAYGQLVLLGYADDDTLREESNGKRRRELYVVHRLDCEVSLVFRDLQFHFACGTDTNVMHGE